MLRTVRFALATLLLALLSAFSAGADDLPHLRLDLPTSLDELNARIASAEAHVTPAQTRLDTARAALRATVQSALHPRADAWFRDPAQAAQLRQRCASDDQTACVALAEAYLDPDQTLPDEPLAYALSLLACEAGLHAGCVIFTDTAWAYATTEGEPLFPATDVFYATCAAGAAGAAADCRRLGELFAGYHSHRAAPLDMDKGRAFFALACEMGDAAACARVPSPPKTPEARFAGVLARCEAGEDQACGHVGAAMLRGVGTAVDAATGLSYLARACAAQNGWSCASLALFYEDGQHVSADPAAALSWRDKACAAGEAESCKKLAHIYQNGVGVAASPARARAYHAQLCRLTQCPPVLTSAEVLAALSGDPSVMPARHQGEAARLLPSCAAGQGAACHRLGVLMTRAPRPAGQRAVHPFAKPLFSMGCDLGHGPACVAFGQMEPLRQGLAAYNRACDLGFLPGCTEHMNRRVGLSSQERLAGLSALCDRGEGTACSLIAALYAGNAYSDIEVRQDRATARAFYDRACEAGDMRGCAALAVYLDPANSPDGDFAQFMALLETTCARGGAEACERLGYEYEEADRDPPHALTRDLPRARDYYLQACRLRSEAETCDAPERLRLILERRALRASLGGMGAALVERPDDFHPYYQAPARRARAACAAGAEGQCLVLAGFYDTYEASAFEGRDEAMARAIYRHLCDASNAEGCFRFADIHRHRGHDSRHDIALRFFDRACEMGHGQACKEAGFFYELGDAAAGGADDEAAAGRYYLRGCALGHAGACDGLSSLFDVPGAQKSAFDLIACLAGDGQACGFIAARYREGRFAPQNRQIAAALFARECRLENRQRCGP